MLVPALFIPQHPFAVLYNRVHLDFSPLPGHDGYDQPGGGSHYHFLHHSKFNCNYGTPMMPM
jgi:sterol desaturase/sphingolipid hydroxylase (fatty acid hydroxylase superfamily)